MRQLTLFVGESPASPIPSQGDDGPPPTSAIYGPTSGELFASLGQDGCWLKTSVGFYPQREVVSSAEYCAIFPAAGTMRNGRLFQQPPLGPIIAEPEYLLLPTLGKNEYKGASRKRYRGSPHFRGAKMSEGLRTCECDPIYLHPSFAELVMGFPIGWSELEPAEMR